MALQTIPNNGFYFASIKDIDAAISGSFAILNAAGESVTLIGKLFIEGEAPSKTLSAAGSGKILWRAGTTTFADGGTNLRVGIQDLGGTGLEDGTFDVYADLVGGVDTITTGTLISTTMETGSRTYNHLETIAISIEMTTRGGVADTVNVLLQSHQVDIHTTGLFPYKTLDTGTGTGKNTTSPIFASIQFDDGTIGWIEGATFIPGFGSGLSSVNVTTTGTNQVGPGFKVPFKCSIRGLKISLTSIASTDTFNVVLFEDPLGTPNPIATVAVNPNNVSSSGAGELVVSFGASYVLDADTWYVIAIVPTAGTVGVNYLSFGSGYDNWKKALPFGSNVGLYSRVNGSGQFSESFVYFMPVFSLIIDGLDDGVGGSGPVSYPFG